MNKRFILSAGLVAAMLASPAFAAEGNGGFIRGEIGNSNLSIDGSDGNDTAYGVRGGYFFNANVGVEAFYTNLGEDSDSGVSADLDGYGIGVVGKKNFDGAHEGFYIDGRLGIQRTNIDVSVAGLGSASDSNNRVYLGAGVGYDFNANTGLSLNVNHTRPELFGETVRITTTTVAFEYRF